MLNNKLNRHLKLVLCTCLVSFFQFIIGASYIFSSTLLAKLKDPESRIRVNAEDASWIASIPILICPVGILTIGILTDKIGRRKSLQIAFIPLILSWLLLANAESLQVVIIGRIILGISLGSGAGAYFYLTEVCPPKNRQLYLSMVTVFVGSGMVTEGILTLFFHWHTVSYILFAMCSVGCLALFAIPETPMWLRSQGRVREAEEAERWLGLEPAVAVVPVPTTDHEVATAFTWKQFVGPTVWKPTLLTVTFFVLQQGSGFYVLLFYSVDVLHDCQVQLDGITVTVFLCVSRVIGSLVCSALHNVKRKTLTVVSSTGMALSLITIILYIRTYKNVTDPPYSLLTIVAFISYVFFALLAMLPLPWTICGELFPMAVKGRMSGIVQVVGYELMFIIIKLYPALVSRFGVENVWTVFTCFCIASAFYGAFLMPETKGKSLDEILEKFESREKATKNSLP